MVKAVHLIEDELLFYYAWFSNFTGAARALF